MRLPCSIIGNDGLADDPALATFLKDLDFSLFRKVTWILILDLIVDLVD